MKKVILLLVLAAFLGVDCHGRKSGSSGASQPTTQTIAPAAGKPSPTGTDAITQTVDIEDSRSTAEGGVASSTKKTTAAPTARTKKKGKK